MSCDTLQVFHYLYHPQFEDVWSTRGLQLTKGCGLQNVDSWSNREPPKLVRPKRHGTQELAKTIQCRVRGRFGHPSMFCSQRTQTEPLLVVETLRPCHAMWYLGAADGDAVRRMCPNILARKASATQSTWTTKQRFSGGRCGHSASEKWRLSQTSIQKITKRDQTSDFHTVANILICDDWIPLFLDVLWLSMVAFRSQLVSWHVLCCFNPMFFVVSIPVSVGGTAMAAWFKSPYP